MKKIAPSMMCVPLDKLRESLDVFEAQGIEYLHVDIMDGSFVPNFTLGTDYVKQLRKLTKIPLDIHLMVEKPEEKMEWFEFQPGESVSVHLESTRHLQLALQKIKAAGAKPMLALNPATPLYAAEYVLEDIGGLLVMTVNPGFAGQKAVPQAVEKIAQARTFLIERGRQDIEIEVDGNVSYSLAPTMSDEGATIFVGGTSSFLSNFSDLGGGIARMRQLVDGVNRP